MSAATSAQLSDLLPTEDSSTSLRAAIAKTDQRRDAELERRAALTRERAQALSTLSMSPKVVHRCETELHEVAIQLERLGIIRAQLYERLKAAIAREEVESEQAAIAQARADYDEATAALKESLPAYEAAADIVAKTCRLEQAQQQALTRYRGAILATLPLGASPPPSVLAEDGPHLALAARVVLPVPRRGGGFVWRQEPPPLNFGNLRYRAEAEIHRR